MTILLFFAFISGIITVLSPCILPILPVVLAGGVGGGKTRSFGIVTGFVVSFTFFTLMLTTIVQAFGISPDVLRIVAVVLIAFFGLVLLVPKLHDWFGIAASRLANLGRMKPGQVGDPEKKKSGLKSFFGGFPVGLSLGLVWTPCVGPIMASVVSLALTESLDGGAVFITLAYSIGTALPMLLIMFTGRTLLTKVPFLVKNSVKIQKAFGVLMIVVAVAIGFGWDRQFQSALLSAFPEYGTGLTAFENTDAVRRELDKRGNPGSETMEPVSFIGTDPPNDGKLSNYGPAPDIVTKGALLNRDALIKRSIDIKGTEDTSLSMEDLSGKVVLVDFWTYSCINCVRTIPYLKKWYEKYADKGFVILGVHTPEFEFEKNKDNVQKAIEDLGVTWPVILDNQYRQWRAYANHYWPAHYFIDAKGNVRYFSFGEGHYETSEKVISTLLEEAGKKVNKTETVVDPGLFSKTPEMYLGYGREKGFVSAVDLKKDQTADYIPVESPSNGQWTLRGKWLVAGEYILPEKQGTLKLGFHSRKVFLVVEPVEKGGRITVKLDGKFVSGAADVSEGVLVPRESRLYEVVNLMEAGPHILELDVAGRLRLFAFTFG
ncbi:MAG: redoxin domain-containing protein [Spirochaetales bacterium]|nr:redoxin domain-containing protein [Spirochaetales bacterium]